MAWVTYQTWNYHDANNTYLENCDFFVQYDDASETPISLKIRFGITGKKGYSIDSCHFLYNPDSGNGTLYTCKNKNDTTYPYYTSSITLSKAYNANYFTLKPFWVCNNGQGAVDVNAATFKTQFSDTGGRKGYAHRVTSNTNISISGTVATDARVGTTGIKDNGNNTFTVSPASVIQGENDPIKGIWSYYQIVNPNDGSIITDWTQGAYKKASTSLDSYTISLPVGKIPGNKVLIVATTEVVVTYGGTTIGNTAHCVSNSNNQEINCYRAPTNPGVPALTTGSFKNGRLTVKQDWSYIWVPATAKGASGIAGYRIRIYKSSVSIKGLTCSNGTISKGTGTNDYVDTESTNTSITFNPSSLGFIPGDTIQISIFAYSKNGKNQITWSVGTTNYNLFSGGGTTAVMSDTTSVQNTGIMRIKLTNTGNTATDWKEGQVLVKVNNTGDVATDWKEADEVKIKTANSTDGWATAE